jgi:hypothetical protein
MEKKDMNFEYEVYELDEIITIHKYDESFFDIPISTYFRWLGSRSLNIYEDNSLKAYNLNFQEYYGMNDYQTIKEHLKMFISETKFKNY